MFNDCNIKAKIVHENRVKIFHDNKSIPDGDIPSIVIKNAMGRSFNIFIFGI
jgi:hypothetical protein